MLAFILLSMVLSLSSCYEFNIYRKNVERDIWRIEDRYYSTLQEAVDSIGSGGSSVNATIFLTMDVLSGESEQLRQGVVIPPSFHGNLTIDFDGYTYEFSSNAPYFFRILGGDEVRIENGMSVIPENSVSDEPAVAADSTSLFIDSHIIDDRRRPRNALSIESGNLTITGESSLKGSFLLSADAGMAVGSGTVRIESISSSGLLEIHGGRIEYPDSITSRIESAVAAGSIPGLFPYHTPEYHSRKEASCTEDGNTAYWYCPGCGQYSGSEDMATIIPSAVIRIPALGHIWSDWKTSDEEHWKECSRCKAKDSRNRHSFCYAYDSNLAARKLTISSTCSVCTWSSSETVHDSGGFFDISTVFGPISVSRISGNSWNIALSRRVPSCTWKGPDHATLFYGPESITVTVESSCSIYCHVYDNEEIEQEIYFITLSR